MAIEIAPTTGCSAGHSFVGANSFAIEIAPTGEKAMGIASSTHPTNAQFAKNADALVDFVGANSFAKGRKAPPAQQEVQCGATGAFFVLCRRNEREEWGGEGRL
ncbi:hypothetical protein [Pseudomonas sp. BN515]|uniref:hypothetical protein n=1 Tax=Pseudomonas sp. BN515 TaxID=2567892 RepID=UPI00245644B0|nr:hypothetical protein [Pseudomonas sp. BN515]